MNSGARGCGHRRHRRWFDITIALSFPFPVSNALFGIWHVTSIPVSAVKGDRRRNTPLGFIRTWRRLRRHPPTKHTARNDVHPSDRTVAGAYQVNPLAHETTKYMDCLPGTPGPIVGAEPTLILMVDICEPRVAGLGELTLELFREPRSPGTGKLEMNAVLNLPWWWLWGGCGPAGAADGAAGGG